jgi:hypothetical protein
MPQAGIVSLLFLAGIVIGLPILGFALWRGRHAPLWLSICLMVGTFTHPFVPGHVLAGVGLMVAGIGFLGMTRALARMSNDRFDLPPEPRPV